MNAASISGRAITLKKVEVIFTLPPYINHNNPADTNGWGDTAFLVKYRLLSANDYLWNNAFQYRAFRKFWPEVELNSTFFQDGKNAGKKQDFATPGNGSKRACTLLVSLCFGGRTSQAALRHPGREESYNCRTKGAQYVH